MGDIMARLHIATLLAATLVVMLPCVSAMAKERVDEGFICVSDSEARRVPEILAAARAQGALIKYKPYGHTCDALFQVPIGLEAWTRNLLVRLGYHPDYSYGTSGGSGPISDTPRDPSWFFSEPINMESLDRISRNTFCKIKTRLAAHFPEVEDRPCGNEAFSNGLCRYYWLGGHVSTALGFGVLKRSIGNKYWVSSKLEVDFGNYVMVNGSDDVNHKQWTVLRVDTLHTVYALYPANKKPEPGQYHNIENDIPGINGEEGDALDSDIAVEVSRILSLNPPLSQDPSCSQ
jgi:hypothetical protein